MAANLRSVCAVLATSLASVFLVLPSGQADAETAAGALGPLSASGTVKVVGNRCGKVRYSWDGSSSEMGPYSNDWYVLLYRGEPDPDLTPHEMGVLMGKNSVDSASGTWPHVTGVDDEPEFTGGFEVCDKADSTKPLSLYGTWSEPFETPSETATQTVRYVVDYHPVEFKVTKTSGFVKARLVRDGEPWKRATVKVLGLSRNALVLKTNGVGVVKIQRSDATTGRTIRFLRSDIAKSKAVRL